MAKTITMPQEEYENDIKAAEQRGLETAYGVIMEVMYRNIQYANTEFNGVGIPREWFQMPLSGGGFARLEYFQENWIRMQEKFKNR